MLIPQAYAAPITNPAPFHTLGELMSAILPAAYGLSGLLLFAYLILGGIKYITAGGDDKAVQAAKKMLTNAIIGMLLVFASFWIIKMIEAVVHFEIVSP